MARLSERNKNLTFIPAPQSPATSAQVALMADDVVPSGWLACNGQAVSRTTYSQLFALIGTTYGTGDGSTTFNLPTIANVVSGVSYMIKAYTDAAGVALGMTNLTISGAFVTTNASQGDVTVSSGTTLTQANLDIQASHTYTVSSGGSVVALANLSVAGTLAVAGDVYVR